jgi:2-polyprenyl-3-methyl-5-hydroxy-6-metoxy-1,4-benzoquinol methylase
MRRMKTPDQSLMFPLNVYSALMRRHANQVPFLSYGGLSESELQTHSDSQALADSQAHSAVSTASLSTPASLAATLIEAQWRRADQILCCVLLAAQSRQHGRADDSVTFADNSRANKPGVNKPGVNKQAVKQQRPFKVLDVGSGSAALAWLLAEHGFEVHALDNNAAAFDVEAADDVSQNSPHFIVCDFENFEHQGEFDVLIFNNSGRYFTPLTLFYKAQSLLRAGGQIVICEEFASNSAVEPDPDTLPVLEHVLALAQRLGFEVLSHADLTQNTTRFQQVFIQLFDCARADLPGLTDFSSDIIDELYLALQSERLASVQGARCHALISLRAPEHSQLASLRDDINLRNAADLSPAAFKLVFEASFDVEFSPELWSWKYDGGRAASVVAERDGVVIAHYGGVVRSIHYFGRVCCAVQICDVMVMPDRRSFFSRNGLFFKTAASMLEQHVGFRAENLLGFGFPNLKAMHVAERLGLYEKTDELIELSLMPTRAAGLASDGLASDGIVQVVDFESVLPLVNRLWEKMLPAFSDAIIGVRDGNYLHHRFVQRPALDYECLTVSFEGEIKALAFRRAHNDGYLLMDIIAAAHDLPAALRAVLLPCESNKLSVFWLTAGQLFRVQHGEDALQVTTTGIQIPCNRWSRGPHAATLAGKWWLTAGDMDFL